MARTIYTAPSAAVVALVATVAKSVIGVAGSTDFGVDWQKYRLGLDGVNAGNTPIQVELCYATFATNPPGTNSTAITPGAVAGRANAATGFLAASGWTAEPTVLAVIDAFTLTPYGGTLVYDFQGLGDTPDSAFSQGFVIRLTAPQAVNVRPTLWFART